MTLHWLEVFVVVAKHLNVTRAAHELHVTQTALSHHLKRLQDTLGFHLTRPTRAGIELTERGAAFLQDAEKILAQMRALKTKYVPLISQRPSENLVVGASHGTSSWLVPRVMAQFAAGCPTVNLRLYTDASAEIEKLIGECKIDIAITTHPARRAEITSAVFRRERLAAFAPADHPLTKLKEIGLSEWAKIPLVIKTGKAGESRTEKLLGEPR